MTWAIAVLAIVAVLVIGLVLVPQLRSRSLKQRFGREYDHLVDEEGDRRSAESHLRERLKRRDSLEINELDPEVRDAYAAEWLDVQQQFIDEPEQSVALADDLVQRVMRDRGYPVEDFDDRMEMVSVDHPELAENYRVARAIQGRSAQQEASTDDLREAFQRYRSLFAELLADGVNDEEPPERDET